jgi:hypothetical protein
LRKADPDNAAKYKRVTVGFEAGKDKTTSYRHSGIAAGSLHDTWGNDNLLETNFQFSKEI